MTSKHDRSVVEVDLVAHVEDADQQAGQQLAARPSPTVAPDTFERWASDPNVSVEKLDGLMKLWERREQMTAEASFNAAMAQAQQQMRRIAADADNPQTHSKYASYAALDRALRPIYTDHGFGLSFDTGDGADTMVRVLCYVTHRDGFKRVYHLDMPADGKGAKGGDVMTRTHATGSAVTYGMRYLLKMIFNVAVGADDDDGNQAPVPDAPPDYERWVDDLTAAADEGYPAFERAWKAAPPKIRTFMANHDKATGIALKARAKTAGV